MDSLDVAFESFVDADVAAKFLAVTRRRVLDLARAGILPAHPLGNGKKRTWRFRLSELSDRVGSAVNFKRGSRAGDRHE